MRNAIRHSGFSLTETLLAVATLAVGLLFVAGTFMVGIHFSAASTERTIAAVVAEEAFGKIGVYGINPGDPNLIPIQGGPNMTRLEDFTVVTVPAYEFAYPSTVDPNASRQYYWAALCRRVDPDPNGSSRLVQVTVFVCRKSAAASAYVGGAGRPLPMLLAVSNTGGNRFLTMTNPDETTWRWINDGYRIVDDATGQIYRVVERPPDRPDVVMLDVGWQSGPAGSVWVVPPPVTGGRGPCIAIYQKTMRF